MIWITTAPPTPNGEMHVGHMAGPYVAADVLRRYHAAEGVPALLTTGIDDHQSYVELRALAEGRTPPEVADDCASAIAQAWSAADVAFDRVVRPRREAGYVAFVQRVFARLHAAGAIVPRTRPLPSCPRCMRWLFEGLVRGSCPHCGAASAGNACEECGRPSACGDLGDPHCALCDSPATLGEQESLFLPLAPFAERLAAFWEAVALPPHLRVLCERMRAEGLPEVAVSQPTRWGVPVPVSGFDHHCVNVWFELAPQYLLALDGPDHRPASGAVQLFGFDNGYFHAVLIPAILAAYDDEIPLPSAFVVNEFYLLEDSKFSTSRRHAVWAREALEAVGSDTLRYQVLANRPTGRQTSFARGDLERAEARLSGRWNGWLQRLFDAVAEECDGVAPREQPAGPGWELLHGRLTRAVGELREAYALPGFDPRRAIAVLDEIVDCAIDFGHTYAHERAAAGERSAYRAALAAQLAVASALAAWAAPALPRGAARLAAHLGLPPGRPVTAAALAPPPAGRPIAAPPDPLFCTVAAPAAAPAVPAGVPA